MGDDRHRCGRLAAGLALLTVGATAAQPRAMQFTPAGKGSAMVSDAAADGGACVAVRVEDEGAGRPLTWPLADGELAPGLYRFSARLRLHLPEDFDHSRLRIDVSLQDRGGPGAHLPLLWSVFDGGRSTYTQFSETFELAAAVHPVVRFAWRVEELPPWMDNRPARPVKAPDIEGADTSLDVAGPAAGDDSVLDDLAELVMADEAVPLASITYPAVLPDWVSIEPLTETLAVAKVQPEKVHVYPGEANPINVLVRNYGAEGASATVRLTVHAGLTESAPSVQAELTVPARGTAAHRFSWVAGPSEFGLEARAEVLVDGKAVHSASEFFSVSTPIWKTAIQGSGFLTWHGREHEFDGHVRGNREIYVNVEEAFSWQPSSWTDLNPTGDDWWSGQNNFHNSMTGLHKWMSLNHSNGIKMITYLWASASGPSGVEWARKYPELVTHEKVGLGAEFHDVEDLRLYDVTHDNEELWDYQYGVWQSFGINRGLLRTMDMGAEQVVESARRFGWDGVRFDSRPTWGAMGAAGVHTEFAMLGVEELMRTLVPEYYDQQEGNWSGSAISIRNIRYMKHRFRTELGPNFAIASNYHVLEDTNTVTRGVGYDYFLAYCEGGCQVNQEALRKSGSWRTFYETLLPQVQYVHDAGGFHGTQSIDDALAHGAACAYLDIFTFAAGSHPYNYVRRGPMPGRYARFMTRYGEFLWDPALKPVPADGSGIRVGAEGLLWEPFLRSRKLTDGGLRTVIQIITPPRQDAIPPATSGPMPAWHRDVVIAKRGTQEPSVWLLSAEPDVRAEMLAPRQEGDGFAVTVAEHRLWSVLVWEEAE